MAYTKIDYNLPDGLSQTGPQITPSIRDNQNAIVDAIVMGGMVDWEMAIVAGTAEEPTKIRYMDRLDSDELLEVDITWNASGNPLTLTYNRTSDNGADWHYIGKKTITWNTSDEVIAISWS